MNIIITGASKGIGRAIAETFIRHGHAIAICSRNAGQLQAEAAALKNLNPRISVYHKACDLAVKEEAIAFGRDVLEYFGRVDVLVNNAGIFLPGDVCTEAEGVLESLMAVNVYSAYHLTRVIANAMKNNAVLDGSRGHIFNMSSVAALKAYPGGGAYSMSKFALEGFSKNLREELKGDLIKVTTVNPGATMSDSWKGSGIDENRIMRAQDVADMIYAVSGLSPQAVVEELVMRPQLGDV
jgi:short-subunit dehydrogenase